VVLSASVGYVPSYLEQLSRNVVIVLIGAVVLVGAAGGAGLAVGKATARQAAVRR